MSVLCSLYGFTILIISYLIKLDFISFIRHSLGKPIRSNERLLVGVRKRTLSSPLVLLLSALLLPILFEIEVISTKYFNRFNSVCPLAIAKLFVSGSYYHRERKRIITDELVVFTEEAVLQPLLQKPTYKATSFWQNSHSLLKDSSVVTTKEVVSSSALSKCSP